MLADVCLGQVFLFLLLPSLLGLVAAAVAAAAAFPNVSPHRKQK